MLGVLLLGAFPFTPSAADESAAVEQALAKQLDEERLAYQLYTALAGHYPNLRQFQNIPRAEARHFEALQRYARQQFPSTETYQLTGPMIDPDTRALFVELYAKGKTSPAAALEVGVAVETLDIRDLNIALAGTDDPQLRAIYERLKAASERHLAAFSGEKGRRGKAPGTNCGKQTSNGNCACGGPGKSAENRPCSRQVEDPCRSRRGGA